MFQLLIDYVCFFFPTIEDDNDTNKCTVLSCSCCGNDLEVEEGNEQVIQEGCA